MLHVSWQCDNLNHLMIYLVEKLGQFAQYNVPPLQLDLCRDRCFFVTEVPQFPQVTLTLRSKAGIVGDF